MMISHVHVRYMTLVLLFTFCQVIGSMCVMPDLSQAQDIAFTEDRMACPMDGNVMCPPSLTSSPKRLVTSILLTNADHLSALHCADVTVTTDRSSPAPWSRSSALSIVPISISSSSVLRI